MSATARLASILGIAMMAACAAPQVPSNLPARLPSARQTSFQENALYFFAGKPDGAAPLTGRLIRDAAGNLYGTTNAGGSGTCTFGHTVTGCGTVFELSRTPGGWTERILYDFQNLGDGAGPWGTLAMDPGGNLYGVTMGGGNSGCVPLFWVYKGCGTVFELTAAGSGQWAKRMLHLFQGGRDGGNPAGGLVLDASGAVYGTTFCGGGTYSCYSEGAGLGTFFQLKRAGGSNWGLRILHVFQRRRLGGAHPLGDLTPGAAGQIYGMAGDLFEMQHTAGRWRYDQLILLGKSFSQGYVPNGSPAFDAAGNSYGTTVTGGSDECNCGVVFEVSRAASGAYVDTVIHEFKGGNDGARPTAGVTVGTDGGVYGTTSNGGDPQCNDGGGCGTVFKLSANGGKWTEHVLHVFEDDATDGGMPGSALLLEPSGDLFGTTEFGGPGPGIGEGSIFEIRR